MWSSGDLVCLADVGAEHLERNAHTPERFDTQVRSALTHADECVDLHRGPRWWSAKGGPEKLPLACDAALRKARRRGTRPTERPQERPQAQQLPVGLGPNMALSRWQATQMQFLSDLPVEVSVLALSG